MLDIERGRRLQVHAGDRPTVVIARRHRRFMVPALSDVPGTAVGVRSGGHEHIVPEDGQQKPKGNGDDGGPDVCHAPSFPWYTSIATVS